MIIEDKISYIVIKTLIQALLAYVLVEAVWHVGVLFYTPRGKNWMWLWERNGFGVIMSFILLMGNILTEQKKESKPSIRCWSMLGQVITLFLLLGHQIENRPLRIGLLLLGGTVSILSQLLLDPWLNKYKKASR